MAQQDPLTHRYPRTLEQAYGPGQRSLTKSARRPFLERKDLPVVVVVAVGLVSIGAACLMGWRL